MEVDVHLKLILVGPTVSSSQGSASSWPGHSHICMVQGTRASLLVLTASAGFFSMGSSTVEVRGARFLP